MNLESGLLALVILIYSAILHEIAHGYVADKLGDPTARLMGRLSLNPQKHLDLWMSVILPLVMFISTGGSFFLAAAKPVPVDPFNLKDGRKDVALVSLAGPLTNVLIAIAAALVIRLLSLDPSSVIFSLLKAVASLNILLAIFNLVPIPPLDGSKVFSLILPERDANTYLSFGSIGMFIIFFLLLSGGLSFIFNLSNFALNLLLP